MAYSEDEDLDPGADEAADVEDNDEGAEAAAGVQAAVPAEKGKAEDDAPKGPKGEAAPKWAITAVRKKDRQRKEAERQLVELRSTLAHMQGQIQALSTARRAEPEEEAIEIDYQDIPGSVSKVAERVAERRFTAAERKRTEGEEQAWRDHVDECFATAMRKRAGDEDAQEELQDALQEYLAMEKADASGRLSRLVRRQADPVEWAYSRVKAKQEGGGGGAVGGLKKQLDEALAKIAELTGEGGDDAPAPQPKPKRLAAQRGAGVRAGGSEAPLNDDSVWAAAYRRRA